MGVKVTTGNDPAAKVRAALAALGIQYEWVEIDPQFADTAVFSEKYGFPMDHCGNTILVASKKEPKKYSACIVQGSMRLDVNKKVSELMGVPRLSFAAAEETMAVTGMLIGGVTPFALPEGIPIYVDERIMELDYVILGSGSRSSKVKMPPAEFRKVPGVQVITGLAMPPKA